ncbi:MAG: hypothetical protein KIT84_12115 [Labilithrix sp.]|nr:hypothetical protein [Labilithrix sp.]MCW5811757.1 hypothetical protein [Labilithrix sp.]
MTLDGKKLRAFGLGALVAGALLATPTAAQAEEVSSTGRGIVGGALLGGELVVFGEAIFGVHSTLAYVIGGVVGAGAGGAGGYFIERGSSDGRVPAYLLAGGIAALIPAIVVTLDATRYRATEGAREDKPTGDLPTSDPGQPGGSSVVGAPTAPAPATPAPASPEPATTPPAEPPPQPAPETDPSGGGTKAPQASRHVPSRPAPSLVGVRNGQLAIGVPVPEVRAIMGATERQRMGVDNRGNEVRFPVLNVAF